jgi:hypothetical protein
MLKVYYLNDKGMHDFGKRMIIIAIYWEGGGLQLPSAPGCYGPGLGVGLGYHVNELQRPLNS